MNSFFVYIDTLDKFLSKKISVNETNTKYITGLLDGEEISCSPSEVDITWTQLVFIKSLQKIWTHGKFYNNSEKETEEEKKAITDYYTNQYLTFVAKEQGTFMFTPKNNNVISYSIDDGSTWTEGNSVVVNSGDKVIWKGTMTPSTSSPYGIGSFSASTNSFDVQGNVMSLLYGDNFKGQTDLSGKTYAFYRLFRRTKAVNAKNLSLPATILATKCYNGMFNDCTSLVTAPELPATTLADDCYQNMFQGCTSLTEAPELPATTLASDCYSSMFDDCISLVTAPELPATTLASNCYSSMFNGCTSLVTAPELPATTLANGCYGGMFNDCTSLVTAPELHATTLADWCYYNMFSGCTSLTEAPELSATILASDCYSSMFKGCTNLNYIKCLATNISATDCTTSWVDGVSATGTFVKADNMSDWTTGVNGVPSGWAARTETDEELVHKYELDQKTSKTINKTWSELKSLRDNSQLVPGQWYRITDYITTTAQANTQSANHAFDVIVRADGTNVLNENAYAALHSGDTYFTNAGAKLEAWQLKYTLDNKYWSLAPHGEQITNYGSVYEYEGTEEINSTTYYKWYRIDYTSTKRYTLGKSVGDTVYSYYSGSTLYENGTIGSYIPASDANGKGTIYWMKDEFNNECSYDFKNIQFKFTSAIENSGIIANVFYYTFSFASGDNDATITDHSLVKYCIRNKVIYMEEDNDKVKLPFNVFRCNNASARFTKNIIIGSNISNTFSSVQYNEIIGVSCDDNSFDEGCFNNKIYGIECSSNKFYEGCGSNSMIGESKSNILGTRSTGNKFDNGRFITLGARCDFNTFESGCYHISLGEYCKNNTFGKSCSHITFGTSESTKSYCRYIIVENGNQYIYLDCSATTSYSAYFQNVKIVQGVNNTDTYKTITHTTAGDTFQTIYQPANSQTISV